MFVPFLRFLQGGESDPPETPVEDKPQISDAPEQTPEQKAEEDAEAEKAAAEKAKTEEFFQTKYQAKCAELDALKSQISSTEDSTPPAPLVPDDEGQSRTLADMTENEFFGRVGEVVTKQTNAVMNKARNESLVQYQSSTAMQKAKEYALELGLSDEEQQRAFEEAKSLGIDVTVPNGPPNFGRALIKEFTLLALTKSSGQRVDAATRNATEEARRQQLTQQPPKAAPPTKKAQTEEDKKLDKMREIQPRSSLSMLDSAREGT